MYCLYATFCGISALRTSYSQADTGVFSQKQRHCQFSICSCLQASRMDSPAISHSMALQKMFSPSMYGLPAPYSVYTHDNEPAPFSSVDSGSPSNECAPMHILARLQTYKSMHWHHCGHTQQRVDTQWNPWQNGNVPTAAECGEHARSVPAQMPAGDIAGSFCMKVARQKGAYTGVVPTRYDLSHDANCTL